MISKRIGKDFLSYLGQFIADGRTAGGRADLCSYFLLRDISIGQRGRVGIIATNTIAQGDTREVGLDRATEMGWAIYRAEKSQHWPGTASLEVALVWATGHLGDAEFRMLDGVEVANITPHLEPMSRVSGNPFTLAANSGISFEGCKPLGMGYVLRPEEAQELISKDPRNKVVIFRYLNGVDLNSRWDCSASRWVINFHDWPIEKAAEYREVFAIVNDKVRPERQRVKPDGDYVLRRPLPQRWWQYAEKRTAMFNAIAELDRVLAIARVSKTALPQFVATGQVMSEATVVFASDSTALLTLLSSSYHYWWAIDNGSSLRGDLRYTPSDIYEKFPQPELTARMHRAGERLDALRRSVMEHRRIGLTELYNLAHDETVLDSDIVRLREIHMEIDEAVREAYARDEERDPAIREYERQKATQPLPSWKEIELEHGFHETRQGERFTISTRAQTDVLDKLTALNHYRYEHEVKQGLRSGKGRGASRKKGAGRTPTGTVPALDDGGLFPPEGTLF